MLDYAGFAIRETKYHLARLYLNGSLSADTGPRYPDASTICGDHRRHSGRPTSKVDVNSAIRRCVFANGCVAKILAMASADGSRPLLSCRAITCLKTRAKWKDWWATSRCHFMVRLPMAGLCKLVERIDRERCTMERRIRLAKVSCD